ncbi:MULTISPECIES: hypothetical protein [unclassified Synechococcus]|uniref:hypothetical protein n=1 Tax=unclassified Synechococcus TaxID=2626047 RepID=UPI0018CE2873|nr:MULTISPECIES: hypothetical protein [unclassified Synechococcus]QPN66663.1 hypothetical protein H8F26_18445 [Synechococcus sp. CBW1006]CAK6692932.1 hypothetical protein IFHNHDMJ_01319 [Synechococcus sp. CBW1107]
MALTPLLLTACAVDRSLTGASFGFVAAVILLGLAALAWLARFRDRIPSRLGLMAVGVLIFELFTAPMWHNAHLGRWAYLYQDVSWVLTFGWSVFFLLVVEIIDQLRPRWRAWRRFTVQLLLITLLTLPLEILVVQLGIRSYAPEVLDAVVGGFVAGVPLQLLFYVPVFTSLVLCFYKYWCLVLEDPLLLPMRRIHWGRGLGLTLVAVLLFEVMVEPMVDNRGFPAWSMLYRDISVLMSGLWILMIAITAAVVSSSFAHRPIAQRFVLALMVATSIALPIEYTLWSLGIRVYGASAVANFSGFTIPLLGAPIEIAFAIPCYLALIICFVRYWDIVIDNHL